MRTKGSTGQKNRDHSNQKKFGNRLWNQMDRCGYDSDQLADIMLALANEDADDNKDSAKKASDKYSYKRRINKHLEDSNTEPELNTRTLKLYARALNCTTDYLLGLDDSPSPQTQTLKETIGIHPGACYRLENYGEPERLVLSNLIYPHVGLKKHATTDYLNNLLHAVYDYGVLASSKNTVLTCENDLLPGFNRSYAGEEAEAVLRYRATMAFERCLDAIRDSVDIRIAEGLAKFIKKSKENPGQFEENLRKEWEKEQEAKKPQQKKNNGIWKPSSRS